eukprot:CAMPEP_0117684106 /NCGR_PEP_ID=MMETSP0804-20121206/20871_1 /TAXON_ID=1074897 /ORGANISM="Tetraselmis astigmatica, Strain CCMP880" /LENGTH=513 /DNA_ID=CAMNT_0005494973 /DNA_START=185 /DNA_END=1726 /DNA_ORIENTATION=-
MTTAPDSEADAGGCGPVPSASAAATALGSLSLEPGCGKGGSQPADEGATERSAELLRLLNELLTESKPDWEAVKALSRPQLRYLLERLLEDGSERLAGAHPDVAADVEASTSFVNNFGRFCTLYIQRPGGGVPELAEDLNSAVVEHFSVSVLVGLLCGDSGGNFPCESLLDLLAGLDVDWGHFSHLGDVACSLLAWSEYNSEPVRIGRLFRSLVFAGSCSATDGFFATEDVVDVIFTLMEDQWDAVTIGNVVKGMLPRWHGDRILDILQTAVSRWIDTDTGNLRQFEHWDHACPENKAMQIGIVVDCLGLPESAALKFCVQFLQWFWTSFPEQDEQQDDDPNLVCCMRGSWFAGRILQQLSVCQDSSYVPLETRAWFGGSWKAELATSLACSLTAAQEDVEAPDWRYDRRRHTYNVGAVLFQLRERWWTAELTSLIQELRRPSNFPEGSGPPPSRIVAEVLEGMNADWDAKLPQLQSLEKSFWLRNISANGTILESAAAGKPPPPEALTSPSK